MTATARATGPLNSHLEVIVAGANCKPPVSLDFAVPYSVQLIEVTGYCKGPVIALSTTQLNFGDITALQPVQRNIFLRNESPIPASIEGIKVIHSWTEKYYRFKLYISYSDNDYDL